MAGGEPIEVQTYCAAYTEDGGLTTAPAFLAEIGVDLVDVSVARSRPPEIARTDHFVEVNAWSVRCATRS